MRKRSLIALTLISLSLVSCKRTSELYKDHAYNTGNFDLNYYTEYNNVDKLEINSLTEIDFSIVADKISNPEGNNFLACLAVEDQLNSKGEKLSWYNDNPEEGYDRDFGPTKCMSQINDKFNYGILSKLYDGRVHCDGYYAESRVQLNKTGFGTFFPKEMKSAKWFGVSVRGASNTYGYKNSTATVNFNFTFYRHIVNSKAVDAYKVSVNNVVVSLHNSVPHGSLLAFYFMEMFASKGLDYSEILNGLVGMSMDYSLVSVSPKNPGDIDEYGALTDDMNDKENPHFAIFLYEMFFGDSTWI